MCIYKSCHLYVSVLWTPVNGCYGIYSGYLIYIIARAYVDIIKQS